MSGKKSKFKSILIIGFILILCMNSYVNAAASITVYSIDGGVEDYITGKGTYFNGSHTFYKDDKGNVVYCVQAKRKGASSSGTSGYTEGAAAVSTSSVIVDALQTIAYRGYPANYRSYAYKGQWGSEAYKSGLLINGTFYECTEQEARAATAFAIHCQMIAIQGQYPDSTDGNEATITDYGNGAKASHDVKAIVDALLDYSGIDAPQIKIQYAKKTENGSYEASTEPVFYETGDGKREDLYFLVTSKQCIIDDAYIVNGLVQLGDPFVKDIINDGLFRRIVHVRCYSNRELDFQLVASTTVSKYGAAKLYGNPTYQDVLVTGYATEPHTQSIRVQRKQPAYHSFPIYKEDRETEDGSPQGDASLAGAKYGLYADEPITGWGIYDGKSFKKGDLVTEAEIQAVNGKYQGTFDNLIPGKYYVQEISAGKGYRVDDTKYPVTVPEAEDVEIPALLLKEDVMRRPFDLKKIESVAGEENPLKGAGFSAWLVSDLKKNADGSYNFEGVSPVILTEDGKTELFTDENGYACSRPLPYGTYIVVETTVPENYEAVEPFPVTLDIDSPTPKECGVFKDDRQKTDMYALKVDKKTGEPLAGASLQVTDIKGNILDSWVSDGTPHLLTGLRAGETYDLTEVKAPAGYHVAETVSFEAKNEGEIQTVTMEDERIYGKLSLIKIGEKVSGIKPAEQEGTAAVFLYQGGGLSNFTFQLYAAEDNLEYEKDALVTELITDENGRAEADGLPIGRYYLVEKETDPQYERLSEPVYLEITEDAVIPQEPYQIEDGALVIWNDFRNMKVEIVKRDKDTKETLSGVNFGIYSGEDYYDGNGEKLLPADTLLEILTTDTNGRAESAGEYPYGKYYIKEIKALDGYKMDETRYDISWSDSSEKQFHFDFVNEKEKQVMGNKETNNKEAKNKAVKTGDPSETGTGIFILCLSAFAGAAVYFLKKKKR